MTIMVSNTDNKRILSGMRTTGRLHLGNYHGALKNWVQLQHEFDCFFFAADWHALTTHYQDPREIEANTWHMIQDWLAAGLDPAHCTIFVQSGVPEHAELHLLLSMLTPLGWLERVPTYKDQQEKLTGRDLATYGFLGYPLLQSADILIYKARYVPVGEDQLAHLELTREVARRFNFLYGREPDFEARAHTVMQKLGKKASKQFSQCVRQYQEQGSVAALEQGVAILQACNNLGVADNERLQGYLEGTGKVILPEPEARLTPVAKFPGLDGQKMSKSYDNTIGLTESPQSIATKIKTMPTDPARVRRTDPGTPEKCPVWGLHQVYNDEATLQWVQAGCTSAGIGCIDCKTRLVDAMEAELAPIRERSEAFADLNLVKGIVHEGQERARSVAKQTLQEVRQAMGLALT